MDKKAQKIRKEFAEAKELVVNLARNRARDECISYLLRQADYNPNAVKILEQQSDEELQAVKALYDETYSDKSNYFKAGAYTACGG